MFQIQLDDLLGKPFKDGGRGPDSFDCWGLACELFRRLGIELPDYKISCEDFSRINGQINTERKKWRRCESQRLVPSLVVIRFNSPLFCNHTGVYLGNGQFIHTREKTGVNIDRIDSPVWRRRIEGFYVPGWLNDYNYSTSESV